MSCLCAWYEHCEYCEVSLEAPKNPNYGASVSFTEEEIMSHCPFCEGRGYIYSSEAEGAGQFYQTKCAMCGGSGKDAAYRPATTVKKT